MKTKGSAKNLLHIIEREFTDFEKLPGQAGFKLYLAVSDQLIRS
jgi:hypothetical protein